jgi:hypothetical protein
MIMTAKTNTPPALELPPRPPSKVEQGLAEAKPPAPAPAAEVERAADHAAEAAQPGADELRAKAIEAMVAAGLPRAYAEASFELREGIADAEPGDAAAEVAELAAESEDFGAPLCPHGCHGPSWRAVPAHLDGVGCEHGSFTRKPAKTDK